MPGLVDSLSCERTPGPVISESLGATLKGLEAAL